MTPNRWIVQRAPRPRAALRLYCFPHAGGGSIAYAPWATELPSWLEAVAVRLPGRENRRNEPAIPDLDQLIAALLQGLEFAEPFALFGHSFGALVAFELSRGLRRAGGPQPRALIVSGRESPTVRSIFPPLHPLEDDALLARLASRYGGIPPVLMQEPELLSLLLPTLRADLRITESYSWRPEAPLDLPMAAFTGAGDAGVRVSAWGAWQEVAARPIVLRTFPGGHFFVQEARPAVLAAVADFLAPVRESA